MQYWLQTLSDMLGWHKIWIDDFIMVTTWPRYNLQTRYKMRTRFCISSSTSSIDFKLWQMCWGDKGITSITSSWLSRDLCAVPRPDGERGLDFVYQVTHVLLTSNFAGYIGVAKKLNHWGHHGGHVTWLQFKDQKQKWDQDLLGLLQYNCFR